MRFIQFEEVVPYFRGKSVAVVGSAPSCYYDNKPGFIESHDVVVRVNNYKTDAPQGMRTDVHFSFYGSSVKKSAEDLQKNGVRLCMCKCPNGKPIQSEWHEKMGKLEGIDYRYIYRARASWWFCDTFIPDDKHYLRVFHLLDRHIPTTGFSAIQDVLACDPASVYLTGFDGFSSGMHNVNEKWRPGREDDPIKHRPDLELAWLRSNRDRHPIRFDSTLSKILEEK